MQKLFRTKNNSNHLLHKITINQYKTIKVQTPQKIVLPIIHCITNLSNLLLILGHLNTL